MVRVIRDFDLDKVTVTLSEEDFETFRRALVDTPRPNDKLRKLLTEPITYIEVDDSDEEIYFNEYLGNLNKYGGVVE